MLVVSVYHGLPLFSHHGPDLSHKKSRSAFAGLWASWRDPEGEMVRSCTIVTTEANGVLRPIHDRMPVLLSWDAEYLWLDDDLQDPGLPGSVLSPYPADLMEAYRVLALVNRPSNDGPEVAAPVGQ